MSASSLMYRFGTTRNAILVARMMSDNQKIVTKMILVLPGPNLDGVPRERLVSTAHPTVQKGKRSIATPGGITPSIEPITSGKVMNTSTMRSRDDCCIQT
jgi:hypothetical protein